jgi:4-hydroxybenzoate polyprenyltransferase
MEPLSASTREYLRTLLVLGRASNIPTVWSNCVAGWLLAGGGPLSGLLLLCLGATCLYVGGMYLNDAFDVNFDRLHRPERPIPSGAITSGEVWGFGLGFLVLGMVMMFLFGPVTGILTVFLVISILIYDWIHKAMAFSPIIMALCRFFLFLTAASTGEDGITGLSVWTALALGCYIVGVSYVAKSESTRGPVKYWPGLLMGVPLGLAWLVNQGEYRSRGIFLCIVVGLWILRNLQFTYWSGEKNVGRTVSGLLAGIVLVDLLAMGGESFRICLAFLVLFAAAVVFQRFIPAT